MKNLLLCCFLFPSLLIGQSLFLTEALPVSTEGTGSRAPRIALLEDNRPVVYWGRTGSNPILYLAIWEDGNFNDPIALNTNGIEPDLWGGGLGPQIAAEGDDIFIVFEEYGEGIYSIKSDDGGTTFSNPVSVYDPAPGRVATLPSVTIDPVGNPIISFVTTNSSEEEALYEITKSLDGGLTFPPTSVANIDALGGEVCECCPASLAAISEEEIYIGFRNNNNNLRDIWVAKSADGGATFSEATDIDDTDWVLQSCPQNGPDIMVAGDSIFTTFFSGANGQNIYFSSLNRETMEAGYQFQIPSFGEDKNQTFPAIAGNTDTLGVVWQELGDNGWEIMLAWSANGSSGLLENSMIIDGSQFSQKQPDIAYHNGAFYIVYEDQITTSVMYRIASFEEIVNDSEINITENFEVKITPNPFHEKTIVSFENSNNDSVFGTLINMNGQVLKNYEVRTDNFEIANLTKGVYFLKIRKGDYISVEKIIVN